MKRISEKTAIEKYGIVKGHWTPAYYLTEEGCVIDSDGCLRYSPIKLTDDQIKEIIKNYEDNKKKLNGSIVDKIPEGWVLNDTQTTPVGYHKYCNNKSHFYSEYDWCLIKDNNKNEI